MKRIVRICVFVLLCGIFCMSAGARNVNFKTRSIWIEMDSKGYFPSIR